MTGIILEKASHYACLSYLADNLLDQPPRIIRAGDTVRVQFDFTNYELEKLTSRFPDMIDVISNLHRLRMVVFTAKHDGATGAALVTRKGSTTADMVVYLKIGDTHMDLSLPHYKQFIVHELRHFQQFVQYNDYYRDAGAKHTYDTNPIEIDAAWMEFIEKVNPAKYSLPTGFADDLMEKFTRYKKLSDKQRTHYYRKSIRIWLDYHMPETKGMDFKQRFAAFKVKKRAELYSMIDINKEIMMNKVVPNYSADKFIISKNLVQQVAGLLARNEAPEGANAIIYLTVLRASGYRGKPLDKLWQVLTGETISQTLDKVPAGSIPPVWDEAALVAYARNGA